MVYFAIQKDGIFAIQNIDWSICVQNGGLFTVWNDGIFIQGHGIFAI